MSRTTPSVINAAMPFFAMRADKITEDAGIRHTHRVNNGDAALRHRLDRRACRFGRGPGFWRCEVFTRRHEAQREGAADQARLAGPQGPNPMLHLQC